MSENLSITDCGSYLLVDFFGEFSVAAGKACIDRMTQACVELGRQKALLDCRKMTGDLPLMDRFQVAEYSQTTVGKIFQIAMVNRVDVMLPDRFVENVAVNRGVNLKIFTDMGEALRWLNEPSSDDTNSPTNAESFETESRQSINEQMS